MVRLAWRDLCGTATVEQTLLETSWLAEALIARATTWAQESCALRHGLPAGTDSALVVLGMGKLGGGELNFSSDVDLVLLYASGEGTAGPLPLSREEFFLQQARVLIRLLDERTADGFVFRVDMRLRPYGDSGPLVCSFAAFEDYLQSEGRDWERYAYVKARALTGQALFAPLQATVLRPFVYRRYLDFGVFDSLREMRGLIAREVARRDLVDHVKLGPGGIREIEFAAKSLQLIRGGQDPLLREVSLLAVLPRLRGGKLLGETAVTQLHEAYLFLRKLENSLQMLDDQQTHSLPAEPLAIERIASAMGFAGETTLRAALDQQRGRVIDCVGAVSLPIKSAATPLLLELLALWEPHSDGKALQEALLSRGIADAGQLLPLLLELPRAPRLRRCSSSCAARAARRSASASRSLARSASNSPRRARSSIRPWATCSRNTT
jgi:glutamate-ammonia-ligase adenylyltransferase